MSIRARKGLMTGFEVAEEKNDFFSGVVEFMYVFLGFL